MAKNPYIKQQDVSLDPNTQNVNEGMNKFVGTVKAFNAGGAVLGIMGSMHNLSWSFIRNALPFGGGGKGVLEDMGGSIAKGLKVQDGISGAIKGIGVVGTVTGVAVALGRGVQAINEFRAGNISSGVAKVVRAAGEGFLSALGVSGIAAVPNIASKIFTGKFLTTHMGDFIENATEGALDAVGGVANSAKNMVSGKPKVATMQSMPAGVAVSANGLPGQGNQTLYANALPPGAQRIQAVQQSAPQEILYPGNIAGKSPTHHRDMVRGGANGIVSTVPPSGDSRFTDRLAVARAQQALQMAQQGV